jgi:hypothetical protein
MGQLDAEFLKEREFSDGTIWDVSIDFDMAADGSEGGYDSHGNYVVPEAMMELVMLRDTVATLGQMLEEAGLDDVDMPPFMIDGGR